MAFDQATRNRLQKFVGDARKLLSDEFTQQLQNTYGLDPVTGGVAELSNLPALSPSEQQTAQLLRDTLEHYLAASHKTDPHKDKALVTAALDRIVREQAFTVLNRLAALRMAEARQFVMESISQGYQSKGFQLYQRIAGSSLGETGQAYQHYLFSVFDELSLDLAVLFDRYSSQGRLFPRETVLLELLDLINHAELDMLWGEDETVGWIYQYFNSKEERKKMRDESQAPRNSRELAVRNQFFTPRYVVEFLTDNTLGRIWYEMTKGKTSLVDSCEYLVRRPNEVFLEEGEAAPEQENETAADLSREELLQQIVHIQHRPLKDPRDIKMLDPACGSMHFGLYAFDLFERIYSEAWDIEADKGREIFFIEEGAMPKDALHEAYPSKVHFLADVPRLIIEHNIHGVDIDPRAAQIAGLSLWLRAQKSWSDNTVKPSHRPQIQRSNIVCAEPMPGETQLLKEFTSQIQPRVLGQLVEEIFEKMQLAGEAGTLLKIEEEIKTAIDDAKSQKDQNILEVQGGLFGDNKWEVREGKRYYNFGDVSDDFWGQAADLILAELERYSETASGQGGGQKRLFSADAARGFAFINLCRKRFDVVLMNPPFGDGSQELLKYLKAKKSYLAKDLAVAFVERSNEIICDRGAVGAITTRTIFYLESFDEWRRENFLKDIKLRSFIDFGMGVLDAVVETAAFVCFKGASTQKAMFIEADRLNFEQSIKGVVRDQTTCRYVSLDFFSSLVSSPFAYKIPPQLIDLTSRSVAYEDNAGVVKQGLGTSDDFRFVRLHWEIKDESKWTWYAKGGSSSGFYSQQHLKVNFENSGAELWSNLSSAGNVRSNVWMLKDTVEKYFYKPGLTFTYRSKIFAPEVLPKGSIFGVTGMSIFPVNETDLFKHLAWCNSSVVNFMILNTAERYEPLFQAGKINKTPWVDFHGEDIGLLARDVVYLKMKIDAIHLASPYFSGLGLNSKSSLEVGYKQYCDVVMADEIMIKDKVAEIDGHLLDLYQILGEDRKQIESDIAERRNNFNSDNSFGSYNDYCSSIIECAVGIVFGRFSKDTLTKNPEKLAECDPFAELPSVQPAVRVGNEVCDFPIFESTELAGKVTCHLEEKFPIHSGLIITDLCEALKVSSLDEYFTVAMKYFEGHLKRFSKSRRQAPIYWPLQSPTGKYTLWINYLCVDAQTLYRCVNDYIEPKYQRVAADLDAERNRVERNDDVISELELFLDELVDLKDEILSVSKSWYPDLNDGVQLNAAPLWKLIKHKPWQKKLRKTWGELEEGKYDWSRMAYNFWTERVLRKCHDDRSMAITHGVAADLWEEVEVSEGKRNKTKLVWQSKDMSEVELDTFIQNKIIKG